MSNIAEVRLGICGTLLVPLEILLKPQGGTLLVPTCGFDNVLQTNINGTQRFSLTHVQISRKPQEQFGS